MHPELRNWLDELFAEEDLETWTIAKQPDLPQTVNDWVQFINQVTMIRSSKWGSGHCTYFWHDSQASQLRFSTAQCGSKDLPFGCKTQLTAAALIVKSWLADPGYIPFSELSEATIREKVTIPEYDTDHSFVLSVYAYEHRAADAKQAH